MQTKEITSGQRNPFLQIRTTVSHHQWYENHDVLSDYVILLLSFEGENESGSSKEDNKGRSGARITPLYWIRINAGGRVFYLLT